MKLKYTNKEILITNDITLKEFKKELLKQKYHDIFDGIEFKWNVAFFLNDRLFCINEFDNYQFVDNDELLILIQLSGG
ncbi:TPA_asm: hypothetical protein GZK45_00945 [Listeria innocua]|uniref:hypothetical protein n=1 Tax=Listeria innocua TaxID=1642 RepID=UPI001623C4C9|nr:hypothetical protein [Listeria innocua]ECL8007211.1 hypothetical protein [Listeria innocua]EIS4945566.1 hypothetical protein [Listeria innocua]MBC1365415.1 hypothetical protein [Listeria innocua]MBC1392241.1 hypothetical protein [Listeria innocua]MBC1406772.1 hypothetical protein [Listeria innocua]